MDFKKNEDKQSDLSSFPGMIILWRACPTWISHSQDFFVFKSMFFSTDNNLRNILLLFYNNFIHNSTFNNN